MNIWEGIYKSFDETKRNGPGFSSDIWIKKSAEKISKILKATGQKKAVPEFVVYRESLLPVISAMIYAQKGAIKILDFGGNFGFEFLSVIHSMGARQAKVEYHILENEDVCVAASKFFKNDKRICFHSALPKNIGKMDIVHLGSSLQYVGDWKKLLEKLANLKPRYILFTDLLAGEIPIYSSVQNYYGSKIPVWFFNVKDIIKELGKNGYKSVFRSQFKGSFWGKEQDVPQKNFPEKFRVKNSCNLLFIKR